MIRYITWTLFVLLLFSGAAQSSEKELVCLFYEDSPGFVEHENIWNTANTRFCT